MSILVNEIILHQLQLQTEGETASLHAQLRESLLEKNNDVEQMMLNLHQAYQAKAKAFGLFKETSVFAQQLNKWLENELDFLDFSAQCAKMLARELGKYPFAANGSFVVCHYRFLATDYLFLALLDSHHSVLVDEALEVKASHYLDVKQYDIACRVNLSELRQNAQSDRYLTFVKGRVGRKIADFFMDFLEADAGFDPKVQNQVLLQAVNDFCEQGELDDKAKQTIKQNAFDYCKAQMSNGEEIALSGLSESLPAVNASSFEAFTQAQDYGLAESIPPVASTLKTLTKFSGAGKGVTLSFNAELLGERVIWDEANDTLLIKQLPPNLKDQLGKNRV